MFNFIRTYLFNYFLQNRLEEHQVAHNFVNLSDSERIGILFDSTDADNIPIIINYVKKLEKARKQVKLLGFIDSNRAATDNLNYDTFSRRNINWYSKPVNGKTEHFIDYKFDILINASLGDIPPLEYITTFSQARFRVGPYYADKTHCYDLMINPTDDSLESYIKEVHHFLETINT